MGDSRASIRIPMTTAFDPLFSGPDGNRRLGLLTKHWLHALDARDPRVHGALALEADLIVSATAAGFMIDDGDGPRLTGPSKNERWLMTRPKIVDLGEGIRTYAVIAVGIRRVKIGRSNDVMRRLKDLQSASPNKLVLLGDIAGDVEGELHRVLRAHKVGHEWFRLNDEVRTALAAVGIGSAG